MSGVPESRNGGERMNALTIDDSDVNAIVLYSSRRLGSGGGMVETR